MIARKESAIIFPKVHAKEADMSKTARNIIFVSAVVLIFGLLITINIVKNKNSIVPDGTLGNSAGNLNNYGLFCEEDGTVYFSNPYDNGNLYRMSSDGSEVKKLCDMSARYINAGGKYVFFYGTPNNDSTGLGSMVSNPGIYRVDKDGDNLKCLTRDTSQSMVLIGNNIYYQHYDKSEGTTFHVLDLSKQKSTELLSYMINPAGVYQGRIYYNGMYDDHYLYCYNTGTGENSLVWEGDIWNPIYDGSFVYYMDVLNNYRLCRYSITDNTIEILTNDRIDFFNIYGDMIYYQVSSSSDPCLKRMRTDGSDQIYVASGVFTGINITSTYTYFTEYGTEYPLYRTPTFGVPDVTEFTAARDALTLKK